MPLVERRVEPEKIFRSLRGLSHQLVATSLEDRTAIGLENVASQLDGLRMFAADMFQGLSAELGRTQHKLVQLTRRVQYVQGRLDDDVELRVRTERERNSMVPKRSSFLPVEPTRIPLLQTLAFKNFQSVLPFHSQLLNRPSDNIYLEFWFDRADANPPLDRIDPFINEGGSDDWQTKAMDRYSKPAYFQQQWLESLRADNQVQRREAARRRGVTSKAVQTLRKRKPKVIKEIKKREERYRHLQHGAEFADQMKQLEQEKQKLAGHDKQKRVSQSLSNLVACSEETPSRSSQQSLDTSIAQSASHYYNRNTDTMSQEDMRISTVSGSSRRRSRPKARPPPPPPPPVPAPPGSASTPCARPRGSSDAAVDASYYDSFDASGNYDVNRNELTPPKSSWTDELPPPPDWLNESASPHNISSVASPPLLGAPPLAPPPAPVLAVGPPPPAPVLQSGRPGHATSGSKRLAPKAPAGGSDRSEKMSSRDALLEAIRNVDKGKQLHSVDVLAWRARNARKARIDATPQDVISLAIQKNMEERRRYIQDDDDDDDDDLDERSSRGSASVCSTAADGWDDDDD